MSTGAATEAATPKKNKKKKEESTGYYTPANRMVKRAAVLMGQAKDPTRLSILLNLEGAPLNVGQLCEVTEIASQPALSHHLALLKGVGAVECEREGKHNNYSLTELGVLIVGIVKQAVELDANR